MCSVCASDILFFCRILYTVDTSSFHNRLYTPKSITSQQLGCEHNERKNKWPTELQFTCFLIWTQWTFSSPKNGKKKTWSFRVEEGCVLKSFLYQSMSGTKSGQEGKQNFNVFCLLTGELMLVKHIRSTVFGSASHFCHCFFSLYMSRRGTGGWRKCSLHHDWACNTFASTFHDQACAFEQRTVETRRGDWVLTLYRFGASTVLYKWLA